MVDGYPRANDIWRLVAPSYTLEHPLLHLTVPRESLCTLTMPLSSQLFSIDLYLTDFSAFESDSYVDLV
jgi:hypothetical protein